MKDHKDKLLDELVKEHAKHGRGDDEAFLTELQQKIEAKDKVVEMPERGKGFSTRWAMGTGVAACLALGFGLKYWMDSRKTEVDTFAYHDAQLKVESAEEEVVPVFRLSGGEKREGNIVADRPSDVPEVASKPVGIVQPSEPSRQTEQSLTPDELMEMRRVAQLREKIASNLSMREMSSELFGGDIGSVNESSLHDARRDLALAKSKVLDNSADYFSAPAASVAPSRQNMPSKMRLRAETATKSEAPGPLLGRPMVCLPHPSEPNSERYGSIVDNKWKAPTDEKSSLSTFAVDVDTASYANIRRMINDGHAIPKDAVRIEEMVNYFDYQYAQPKGEHPFAVHIDSGVAPWNPQNRLVRVGIQGKDIIREERPATNLVFLLDVSGSMNSAKKLPLLKESMKYLLEELNADDKVSIVVYAGASGLALPATKMDDAGRLKVMDKLNSLSAGGSTAGGQGIKLAYKVAQENFIKGGVNRIVLATDGDFNVGISDTGALTKLVKEKAKAGTFISVLGFGSGNINDAMLESITNNGNGNYSYIDSIKEGRKVLLEDMMGTIVTIAKDVKVQVQMNPAKVKAYRLIGYANRILPPEAFLDKTVDAGEIGAGHTVTALYEIMPYDGKPFGENIDGSRYFKQEEVKPDPKIKESDELLFVKLAYKQPEDKQNDESTYFNVPFVDDLNVQPSDDLTFASSVALMGMHLRESIHKGNGDLQMVRKLAEAGKGSDGKGQRAEFIKMVEKLSEKEQ